MLLCVGFGFMEEARSTRPYLYKLLHPSVRSTHFDCSQCDGALLPS
jgi:hypothetical protein